MPKLLLDSHIFLSVLKRQPYRHGPAIENLLGDDRHQLHLSVASLWEISIKWRLGKLPMIQRPDELAPVAAEFGIVILPIDQVHATTEVEPEPPTRDPFDRMLLAQCHVEGLRLVTVDRALAAHPLAFQPT